MKLRNKVESYLALTTQIDEYNQLTETQKQVFIQTHWMGYGRSPYIDAMGAARSAK